MKVIVIKDESVDKARTKLIDSLSVQEHDLRFVREDKAGFTFEVLSCPPLVEMEISRDGLKATWKKLEPPIGPTAPPLTVEVIKQIMTKQGVVFGLKDEVIEKEVNRVLKMSNLPDSIPINLVVAEGLEALPAQAGKPKWVIDPKAFEKGLPVFARKGEAVAVCGLVSKGQEGKKVTGEVIKPAIQEEQRLVVGNGIEVIQRPQDVAYVTKCFGRLQLDQGVRIRVECKVIDKDDGLVAVVETPRLSFTGAKIIPADLLEFAKEAGVSYGYLAEPQILEQLEKVKKGLGQVVVAKGQNPVDGAAGSVKFVYQDAKSDKPMDVARAKANIVFPKETIAIIGLPTEPVAGKTVYGETLRGRNYQESPIYPGKNVVREKEGDKVLMKASSYGKVSVDADRINVENLLKVSEDSMMVTLDLFPQEKLTGSDLLNLLKDKDVLFGYEKDQLDALLEQAFAKGVRQEELVVARGKTFQKGQDATLKFNFKPEEFKTGFFQKKASVVMLAAPGDVLMEKILPIDAEDGTNVFRERIPVPAAQEGKDIPIEAGDNIKEVEVGQVGSAQDPRRILYKANALGMLIWKDPKYIDVQSTLVFDKDEKFVQLSFAPKSDFGTPVTLELIQNLAAHEGVKVNLETVEIQKVLRVPRAIGAPLTTVTIAKGVDPKEGEDSKVSYLVEFNGAPIEKFLYRAEGTKDAAPEFCDCVRPKDVLAVKTPAGQGEDGKSVFGRRLPATRGKDEPWLNGSGVDKTENKLQLFCSLPTPGYVIVEGGRITVQNPARVGKDKMSATISIFPTNNPRFKPSEDKIQQMLAGAGVKKGILKERIVDAIEECLSSEKPMIDVVVAEGKAATRGKDASFYISLDLGENVGQKREDGSVDFKSRSVYQNVKAGQLLIVKHPPQLGQEGYDVLGNVLPAMLGFEVKMEAAEGVKVSENGLEYRAAIDGIVEIHQTSIRVMPGLFVSEDISFKTGNINAGNTQVIVKGSVLPDFKVTSDRDITIEKVAEACVIEAGAAVRVRGGIIGRDKAIVRAGTNVDAFYISAGATVEAQANVVAGSEILNSKVRAGGFIQCTDGAGTVYGGELIAYAGIKARTIGAAGAETPTVIRLGENFFKQREVESKIAELGLTDQIKDFEAKARALGKELNEIYARIPEASKTDVSLSQRLQEDYRRVFEERKKVVADLEKVQKKREEILAEVPMNPDAGVTVTEIIHPGTTIIYKDVVWVLKEPMRGVEIRWNSSTSNLVSRRIQS